MNRTVIFMLSLFLALPGKSQMLQQDPKPGYELRIKQYVDTLTVFDTHEHLYDPDILQRADFLDFAMLFLENGYNDLISAGMPDTLFNTIFSPSLPPAAKWKIIDPFWERSFNTANNRILIRSINDIYKVGRLDSATVLALSQRMKKSWSGEWFDSIVQKSCRIDFIVQDGKHLTQDKGYVRYAERFNPWILVRSKYAIDSIAIRQLDPIYTLEDFIKSLGNAFDKALKSGMAVTKIDIAYQRQISFENVSTDAARKVFKTLVSGNEDFRLTQKDAKPLQDYMVFQLLSMARDHKIPVAFHTGFQAGNKNYISNSNPLLLTNLFFSFPDVKFVLFHGSYPFGGELSVLAKTFKNVSIDMNWTYDISPAFAARYLDEWLETAPLNKIMAFGGDQRMIEMTYGSLMVAKKVVADVLTEKVKNRYFSEEEAKTAARMLLHDNGMEFYNIRVP